MDQLVQRGTLPPDFVSGAIALARYFEVAAQFSSAAKNAEHPAEERFVAAMRLAQLLVEQLPRHPDLARYPRWQQHLRDQAVLAVRLAESLKLDLRAQRLGLALPAAAAAPPPPPPPALVAAAAEPEPQEEPKKHAAIAPVPGRGGRRRAVRVAAGLFEQFGRAAAGNTARNVETCGLLCGREEGGALVLDTVLVPEQTGTADTCGATDEEGLLEAQLRAGLSCLGWIHTHPRHACFLSSVDLHTSVSYQALLPEALAVVLAPTDSRSQASLLLFPFVWIPDGGCDRWACFSCRRAGCG